MICSQIFFLVVFRILKWKVTARLILAVELTAKDVKVYES